MYYTGFNTLLNETATLLMFPSQSKLWVVAGFSIQRVHDLL